MTSDTFLAKSSTNLPPTTAANRLDIYFCARLRTISFRCPAFALEFLTQPFAIYINNIFTHDAS